MAALLARALPFLALLLAIVPTAWGQWQGVGVVTALTGKADLKRAQDPQAAALRLRDPLAVRDVVETREESLARILLLGKTTVTVRELSRFEIREEKLPDGAERAGIDLAAGRIRVMVARRLMKPGDEIQIRTLNAIAGVRGSEAVVEVMRLPDGQPRTVVTGVEGELEVSLPSTRPFTAMAQVVSDAGPSIRLVQLQIPGGGAVRRFDRLQIDGAAGLQRVARSIISNQDLHLLLRGFDIRHIRGAQTSEARDAARARSESTRDGTPPGPSGPPSPGGPAITPPNVILPINPSFRVTPRVTPPSSPED